MADTEVEQTRDKFCVTIHELDDQGVPIVELGTATIIGPDAVVLDFHISTLPLRLGIIASSEAITDTDGSKRLGDGSHLFNVMTIHTGTAATRGNPVAPGAPGAPDKVSMDDRLLVALEISGPALELPPLEQHSARSFWCNLFPHLQACNRRR